MTASMFISWLIGTVAGTGVGILIAMLAIWLFNRSRSKNPNDPPPKNPKADSCRERLSGHQFTSGRRSESGMASCAQEGGSRSRKIMAGEVGSSSGRNS